MRRPVIAGNWKMNTTIDEAVALVSAMKPGLSAIDGVDRIICPPFVSLQPVGLLLSGSGIELGAQNMFSKERGAYTGEISALMLQGLCKYVIVGHSERRHIFGESDELVSEKVGGALAANLVPILCIGETLAENESGRTEEVLARQVRSGLSDVKSTAAVIIAYEPVWAIGTGKAATARQAGQTIQFIRGLVGSAFGADAAGAMRILYGGSVTVSNTEELASQPDIDGALVGGASLNADEFVEIVRLAQKTKRST